MNHFGKLHRISLILNIMFLILMPKIYSFDNIYLSMAIVQPFYDI